MFGTKVVASVYHSPVTAMLLVTIAEAITPIITNSLVFMMKDEVSLFDVALAFKDGITGKISNDSFANDFPLTKQESTSENKA
jgi:hypothetical protein